jgi:Zn-dependent M28 family amino/carboxypeptidase
VSAGETPGGLGVYVAPSRRIGFLMKRFLLLLALAGCAPSGGAAPAAPPSIDGDRLLEHVRVLAHDSMQGRRADSPGSAKARRYLLSEFRRIGLEPVGASYEHPFTFTARRDSTTTRRGVNLLGKVTGTRYPDRYLVVTAHYDHVGVGRPVEGDSIYNGADDNASGTAALLELAAYFRKHRPASTVVFAALDAEETGLRGAQAFVEAPPVPKGTVVLNVNLDMVSHSEKGELYAAGTSHSPFLRPLLDSVAARAPVKLLFGHDRPVPTPGDDWTLQSDHGAFHRAGIPFVYFGVEDHPDYHKPSDEFSSITPGFFVGAARTVLDAVRVLDRNLLEIDRRRVRR